MFAAVRRLSLVAVSGGYSSLQCTGLSSWWLLLLWSRGSRRAGFSSCGSRALECRLSSCGARAYLLRGMWDLPGPGLEPVSPVLAGGFFNHCTTREVWRNDFKCFRSLQGKYQLLSISHLIYLPYLF